MDINEAERVVVAKPVASRPTWSTFRSFSDLLADAINASPHNESSETAVAAIRPKTVRFKPLVNHASVGIVSSQAEIPGAAPCNSSEKIPRPDNEGSTVYKPLAKLVSKTTVSLLANMGNSNAIQQQPRHPIEAFVQQYPSQEKNNFETHLSPIIRQNISSCADTVQTTKPSVMTLQNLEKDQKSLPPTSNNDRPSYDGYNWRKYGQKKVKGSEYPRSYYKCTHPNCPVKKKVERSFDGQIAEIVYKGVHNHSKPQPPKRNSSGKQGAEFVSDGMSQDISNPQWSNHLSERNEGSEGRLENQNDTGLSMNWTYQGKVPNDPVPTGAVEASGGSPKNSCGISEECEEGIRGLEPEEDGPRSKRRKIINQSNDVGMSGEGLLEPGILVQSSRDSEILGDGFRWRKYGQKVVKGNAYPRSYYRCTSIKCNVRKHVERASDDSRAFITTYEGKHNHEMPLRKTSSVASEIDLQASTGKEKL
ncbi:WRKY transcription factor [Quillaja saponaria]|uniref:WRKY transcription factor n=1 Tax=Quillaja saponaria TaxID=32244 RepID=A0AAD7Q8U6_QUISA|nr:WRKY transcription factor [Quillaja saponaria]